MALRKKINTLLKSYNDTGFGSNAENYGGRFVNKDGSFNVKKEGLPFWERFSMFHTMINLPTWKFISIIVIVFILINLLFAIIYWIIGVPEFAGIITESKRHVFSE